MTGEALRDERDELQTQIEGLILDRYRIKSARRWLNLTQCAQEFDSLGEALDRLANEIMTLEKQMDEAEATVAREDPERPVWGHDGL